MRNSMKYHQILSNFLVSFIIFCFFFFIIWLLGKGYQRNTFTLIMGLNFKNFIKIKHHQSVLTILVKNVMGNGLFDTNFSSFHYPSRKHISSTKHLHLIRFSAVVFVPLGLSLRLPQLLSPGDSTLVSFL